MLDLPEDLTSEALQQLREWSPPAQDEMPVEWEAGMAFDRATAPTERLSFAFDRMVNETARDTDADGRMHVSGTNISKACVNEYLGSEIPDYKELGLVPGRLYRLYRDPEELKKGARTFARLPVLDKHVPVDAENHRKGIVIGTTGSDPKFVHPFLKNSIAFWTQEAIDDIESEERKELSSAYRYRADMTPGVSPEGEQYDGVMREIVGNHVALVKQGRAGPDVVVGDSKENLDMAKAAAVKMTNKGRSVLAIVAQHVKPILAADQALPDLRSVLAKLSRKNFAEVKPKLVTELGKVKLAKDAKLDGIMKLVDALEDTDVANADAEVDVPPVDPGAAVDPVDTMDAEEKDGEGLKGFLKGKLSEDDYNAACGMMGGKAKDEDPDAKKDDEEDKKDEDPKAEDAEEYDEKDKDKDPPMSKKAMDAAIKHNVEAALKTERANARAVREAEEAVRPYVGKIAIAQDSALGVFQTALEMLGVPEAKDIDSIPACKAVLSVQKKPGSNPEYVAPAHVAMDAAQADSFAKRFPGIKNITIG